MLMKKSVKKNLIAKKYYILVYTCITKTKKFNIILDKMLVLLILIYDKKINNLMFVETLFALYFEIC